MPINITLNLKAKFKIIIIIILIIITLFIGLKYVSKEYFTNDKDIIEKYSFYIPIGCFKYNNKLFNRRIKFTDEPNILEKCADIAKGFGSKYFGLLDRDTGFINLAVSDMSDVKIADSCGSIYGDGDHIFVYAWNDKINKKDVQDFSYYKDLGCYNDDGELAIDKVNNTLLKKYKDVSNKILQCAFIAKEKGWNTFALQNGQCMSDAEAHKTYDIFGKTTGCSETGSENKNRVFRWNGKVAELDPIKVDYDMNVHPFINAISISDIIKQGSDRRMRKFGIKYGLNSENPIQDILKKSLQYTDSKKFYDDVFIGQKYDTIFKDAFNIMIDRKSVKKHGESNKFKYGIDDLTKHVFPRLLNNVRALYGIEYVRSISDRSATKDESMIHRKNIEKEKTTMSKLIITILELKGDSDKVHIVDSYQNRVFSDFLGYDNNYFKTILQHIFKITFLEEKYNWEHKCHISTDGKNYTGMFECYNNYGEHVNDEKCRYIPQPEKKMSCDFLIGNNDQLLYKWKEECAINEEETEYEPIYFCMDNNGGYVDDELCSRIKKPMTSKCGGLIAPKTYKWIERCEKDKEGIYMGVYNCVDKNNNKTDSAFCEGKEKSASMCKKMGEEMLYRWNEKCNLNEDGTGFISRFECVDANNNIVPESKCINKKKIVTNKCKEKLFAKQNNKKNDKVIESFNVPDHYQYDRKYGSLYMIR